MAALEEVLGEIYREVRPRGWEYAAVGPWLVGRVLAEDLRAALDEPPDNLCPLDGYLVRPGVGPAKLRVVGSCGPGDRVQGAPEGGALEAYTGCAVAGDDAALLPLEEARAEGGWVLVPRPLRPLENMERRGSWARSGSALLPRGRRVRPADVELMASLGVEVAKVYLRPRVAIISVGSEISMGSRVVGTTRYLTLEAVAAALGAEPVNAGPAEDSEASIAGAIARALEVADVVLTVGGTGPSSRDATLRALDSLGPSYSFRSVDVANLGNLSGAIVEGKPVIALPGPRMPMVNGLVLVASRAISASSGEPEPPELPAPARLKGELSLGRRAVLWFRLSGFPPEAEPLALDRGGFALAGASGYAVVGPGDLRGELAVRVPLYL